MKSPTVLACLIVSALQCICTSTVLGQFELYVADSSRVVKVNADGTSSTFIPSLSGAIDIALDSQGFFYVAENGPNLITKYAPDGQSLGVFANLGSDGVVGVDIDGIGNVFAISDGGSKVTKFDAAGNFISESGVVLNPSDIIIDSDNNIYVSDLNADEIWKYDNDGANGELFAELEMATYMTYGPNGNLFVAQLLQDTVSEISTDGTDLGVFAAGGLQQANAIVFDPFGNLYVGDNAANNIRKYSPDGDDLGIFSTGVNVPIGMVMVSTVPEPNTLALFFGGFLGFFSTRRRKPSMACV